MKRRGFSLIELLVTVLITSIIVIAAYQLLTSTTNSFGDEDSRRMLEANLRNAELLIQRDIARTGFGYGYSADGSVPGSPRRFQEVCRAARLGDVEFEKKLAFRHAFDDAGNSVIQIVASISDYDDFTISTYRGGLVTLNRTVTLPLVASDVYVGTKGSDPGNLTSNAADEATFSAIFNRVFRGASAVEIATPDTGTVVAEITSVDANEGTFTISSQADGRLAGFCNIDPERPLIENVVNPIMAMTYRVKDNRLERCVTSVMRPDFDLSNLNGATDGAAASEFCDVLLENVVYFQAFPITNDVVGGVMEFPDPTDIDLADRWRDIRMGNLYGAIFRIGAVTPTSLKNVPDGVDIFTDRYHTVNEETEGGMALGNYLLSHARGAALFQEPHLDNPTVPTPGSSEDLNVGSTLPTS